MFMYVCMAAYVYVRMYGYPDLRLCMATYVYVRIYGYPDLSLCTANLTEVFRAFSSVVRQMPG
jgi:hypothetical protein